MRDNDRWLAAVALLVCVAAVAAFGASSPDFGQLRQPVALLGADGEPNALAFNLLGFVLPGALLGWLAWRWRSQAGRKPSWPCRDSMTESTVPGRACAISSESRTG